MNLEKLTKMFSSDELMWLKREGIRLQDLRDRSPEEIDDIRKWLADVTENLERLDEIYRTGKRRKQNDNPFMQEKKRRLL